MDKEIKGDIINNIKNNQTLPRHLLGYYIERRIMGLRNDVLREKNEMRKYLNHLQR